MSSEQSGKPQPTRFVARQPIFDRTLRVIGYELLFRDGITNHFTASDVQAAFRPVLDWDVLESLVKQEPSLCYRLLRYLNSPAFGLLNEIRSVRHALTILGEREIRKWISVVATLAMGSRKPGELVQTALLRGHFCELISRQLHQRTSDAFLLGLLSLMDAILGIPLSEVLRRVSVDNKIKEALLHEPSPLLPVYELVLAHENANWEECRRIAEGPKLQEAELGELSGIDSMGGYGDAVVNCRHTARHDLLCKTENTLGLRVSLGHR